MRRVHPAPLVLGGIAILTLIALWLLGEWLRTNQGVSWTGEPTPEQLLVIAVSRLSWTLLPALAFAAAGSVLGLVFAWCFRKPARAPRAARIDATP